MRCSVVATVLVLASACGLSPDTVCDDTNNPCGRGETCVRGLCQAAAQATCTDGMKNGTETDVDCGGPCAPCGATLACMTPDDCASATCVNNRCACPAGQHVDALTCVSNTDVACGADRTNCTLAITGGTGVCDSASGTCRASACDAGHHLCNAGCAANTSTASCGLSSCAPCPVPANGSATCDGAGCGITCSGGFHVTGGSCDPDSDTACGSPPKDCTKAYANGTGACSGGSCHLTSCNPTYHAAGDACVSDAVTNCGGHDCTVDPWRDPNGTMTCNGGCAVASCNPGWHTNAASTACLQSTDVCCGPGGGCSDCTTAFGSGNGGFCAGTATTNGACQVSSCATGSHVDLAVNACVANSDTACGSPGNDCTKIANATATCNTSTGTCQVTCNSGYHLNASGTCDANTDTSCGSPPQNCTTAFVNGIGACDATSGTCFLGSCVAGFHACGSSCWSDTDVNHCGASCTVCAQTDPNATFTCGGGACVATCKTGYNRCNGATACKAETVTACGSDCYDCRLDGDNACVSGVCRCSGPTCKL